jgi:uncharacterized membrane protein YiaA
LNVLYDKFKEVALSVIPITIIVLILNLTIAPVETYLMLRFLVGAVLIIIGLSIFLFGAEIGIEPLGSLMGSALAKNKKLWKAVVFGFILGFLITIAEPDLQILAQQVNDVTSGMITKTSILVVVSVGVGAMLVMGLLRIVFNIPINKLLAILYGIIFFLTIFTTPEFLAIAFDASGATTGAMAVPFILAVGLGVSSAKGGKDAHEDSFGFVGIASTGPILSVLIMSIIYKTESLTSNLAYDNLATKDVLLPFIHEAPKTIFDVVVALLPLLVIFCVFQGLSFKLSRYRFIKILKGLLYTFIGLVLFLTGVNAGFMEVGSTVGYAVASLENNWVLVPIGFLLGLVVILAEPAVHVLTEQIEDVTSGYIKRKFILYSLSIGVAFAVALSMLRIMVPEIRLWHYLVPGFLAAIIMSFFSPKLFVGIAFDSGGVASGPMTATFILAFAQGAAEAIDGANVLVDAFGVIAMVAMTPLIALQVLGLLYKRKASREGVEAIEKSDV